MIGGSARLLGEAHSFPESGDSPLSTRTVDRSARLSQIEIVPEIPICQTDLPLDRYQEEFQPYAEEYLALPDRTPETLLPWMDSYLNPALREFGDRLMLLAHYYMGGEIVKLVERYGGRIADSYELALQAAAHQEVDTVVESAVHFMAEAIATMAHPHQKVYITNPRAGCTMEMFAKEYHIQPAFDELRERYGEDLMVLAYMNTSGRVKAMAGATGGAVCTSSNAKHIMNWALAEGKKIFFVPDRHLAEVVCWQTGITPEQQFQWGGGTDGMQQRLANFDAAELQQLDQAKVIKWGSYCGVHTVFRPEMVEYWKGQGYRVLAHPECTLEVVQAADGAGSTKYLWGEVMNAPPGAKLAIGTEGHFVRNAMTQGALRGVKIVHLAEVPGYQAAGCGCATMSRNDPPHLVAMVDLLRKGRAPDLNLVEVGDVVEETTGHRERLDSDEQENVRVNARSALQRMVEITESQQ